MLAKTPLHSNHLACGAKMLDFHGWDMPLHYGSQIKEHLQVRQDAGMFDVSHMAIVDVLGAGGRQFLRKLLTNDVDQLTHSGKALYSCMCNEHGSSPKVAVKIHFSPPHLILLNNCNNLVLNR